MIELENLSRIGFGCHRVSAESSQHLKAARRAMELGCNLFDTSANYTNGESELLIGELLSSGRTRNVFVVTKSGYDEREHLELVETGAARGNLLYPEFLRNRIDLSLSRLGRPWVDGFLLHSPEGPFESRTGAGVTKSLEQTGFHRVKLTESLAEPAGFAVELVPTGPHLFDVVGFFHR